MFGRYEDVFRSRKERRVGVRWGCVGGCVEEQDECRWSWLRSLEVELENSK